MNHKVRKFEYKGQLLALIIRDDQGEEGARFYTSNDLSQQVAVMCHRAGTKIDAHLHIQQKREVHYTQEVLILRKGVLRIDLYDNNKKYLESCLAKSGDIVLLISGGHGFRVMEDVEMIEVKQGPFIPASDKVRFKEIPEHDVKIKKL